MKVENRQTLFPWQDAHGDDDSKLIEEGSHYSIPIQITVADNWQHEAYEERSPEAIQQQARGSNYQQMATGYVREQADPTPWETFMDTLAFPEKAMPIVAKHVGPTFEYYTRDWTGEDVKEAMLVACSDTLLCGDPNEKDDGEDGEEDSEFDEL